jgi:hypothetical protein
MNSPIFTGQYKELGNEVEVMAHDLRISVYDILRIGSERLLREWERTGSIMLGSGRPPELEPRGEVVTLSSGKGHPLFGDTKPNRPRKRAA